MSLEWARARLQQHLEALRKLCEAQATARPGQPPPLSSRRRAAVTVLRVDPRARPPADAAETGTVLEFVPPGRRRRA